jgi:CRISPR-associated protein (TIGR03984 family)
MNLAFCSHTLSDQAIETILSLESDCGLQWLLAHCDDGIIWGKAKDGKWQCSSGMGRSPFFDQKRLQQLRLFGEKAEILIWRTSNGFQGRQLEDIEACETGLESFEENQILIGNRIHKKHEDFTEVLDRDGRTQVVPLELSDKDFYNKNNHPGAYPLRLTVRHYPDLDPIQHTLRIVVSRLVGISLERRL